MSNLSIHIILKVFELVEGIFSILEINDWLFDEDKFINEVIWNVYSNAFYQYIKFKGYFIRIEPILVNKIMLVSQAVVNVLTIIYTVRLVAFKVHKKGYFHITCSQLNATSIHKKPNTFDSGLGFFIRSRHCESEVFEKRKPKRVNDR